MITVTDRIDFWLSKFSDEDIVDIYRAYVEGSRSPLFLQTTPERIDTIPGMPERIVKFLGRFKPVTNIELIESYVLRVLLIISRLRVNSQSIPKIENILLPAIFQRLFLCEPFTSGEIIFLIRDFEELGIIKDPYFAGECQQAHEKYQEKYHVSRGNSLQNYINFAQIFLTNYDRITDLFYAFYLLLLIVLMVHELTGVVEPEAVAD